MYIESLQSKITSEQEMILD